MKYTEKQIGSILLEHGFKGHGKLWHRQSEDIWQVVFITNSRFSKEMFLDVGVVIEPLDRELWKFPLEWQVHVRADRVYHDRKRYLETFDEDVSMEDVERIGNMASIWSEVEEGYFSRLRSKADVMEFARTNLQRNIFVSAETMAEATGETVEAVQAKRAYNAEMERQKNLAAFWARQALKDKD